MTCLVNRRIRGVRKSAREAGIVRHNYVTAQELSDYANDQEIDLCGHYGEGYHAQVTYHVGSGMFNVYDHRTLIASHADAHAAAEAYNQIRPHVT